ncbi:MAG: sigma-54 dependent transcriptional regulator [Longimicrobiales bacterium]|nr:sigma-54 dependent transcriptional regulator [Longimicrobiales bacterium]
MSQGRLMVVDDDRALRETLRDHLLELGFEVLAAESGSGALNRIADFSPDLVLSDVQMPGMSGFELLGHLREKRPDTDVVIFTGHADVDGAINAIKAGACDYLIKPLDLDEAEEVIQRCLEKRRSARSAGAPAEMSPAAPPHGLVGMHPRMVDVYKAIGGMASSDATVLLQGETGTGKELVARAIHESSSRVRGPFVGVNCAAVPAELLESELFGHVKGAFTGAAADRRGKFEAAAGGTLFLDEIGDTAPEFQAKLLRVLQEREFYPVGGDAPRRADVRVIAATHHALAERVAAGTFRQDLLYRLQVLEIQLPPLRERRSDIPHLVRYLVARAAAAAGITPPVVPPDVMAHLAGREWPGNVRELENVLTRATVLSAGPALTLADVAGCARHPSGVGVAGATPPPSEAGPATLEAVRSSVERDHVRRILDEVGGNKSRAARVLGVSRPTLNRLIRDHQLVAS